MVQAVRMPMMGNTMERGLVLEWRVDEGESVAEGDVIVEIESEKTASEVRAAQDGQLARVDVESGESVPPGTILGVVLGSEESLEDAPTPGSIDDEAVAAAETHGETDSGPAATDDGDGESAEETVVATASQSRGATEDESGRDAVDGPTTATGPTFASPRTRRLSREHGISIEDINGTGVGGRVTESDVRRAIGVGSPPDDQATGPAAGTAASTSVVPDPDQVGVTVVEARPLTGMRSTIADRMARSAREAPHVTLDRDVSVGRALQTAEELAAEADASIGFVDLLIGASVRALNAYATFNAWFDGDTIRLVDERNVAVAVDVDGGLVTPVIRSAAERSLADIAAERRRLTSAVLDGEYGASDLQGGTFTITNLGMFGVDSFDPVINPPQVAILGVGRIREDGPDRTCTLSLSFDHRVVDGADAARFLDVLAEGIEAPSVVVSNSATAAAAADAGSEGGSGPSDAGETDVAATIERSLESAASEIAAVHDWPVPSFGVDLDGGPSVTVEAPDDASPATMKRLTYAACRDSTYADTIAGLRDPDIEIRRPA